MSIGERQQGITHNGSGIAEGRGLQHKSNIDAKS